MRWKLKEKSDGSSNGLESRNRLKGVDVREAMGFRSFGDVSRRSKTSCKTERERVKGVSRSEWVTVCRKGEGGREK